MRVIIFIKSGNISYHTETACRIVVQLKRHLNLSTVLIVDSCQIGLDVIGPIVAIRYDLLIFTKRVHLVCERKRRWEVKLGCIARIVDLYSEAAIGVRHLVSDRDLVAPCGKPWHNQIADG